MLIFSQGLIIVIYRHENRHSRLYARTFIINLFVVDYSENCDYIVSDIESGELIIAIELRLLIARYNLADYLAFLSELIFGL